MRIVHLIEPDAPGVSPMLPLMVEAAKLAMRGEAEHVVHTPSGHCGGWWSLRQLLKSCDADVIHAWSERAMVSAAMAASGQPIIATLTGPPTLARPTAMLLRRTSLTLLVPSEHLREQWRDRGLRDQQVRVAAPPMSLGDHSVPAERTATRLRWGVADDRTSIILVTGPVAGAQDAMLAMLSAGLAAETGRPIRLLISPGARGIDRARRMAAASGRNATLIVHEAADAPWEVRDAIDLALAMDDGPGVLWAMHARLPIAGHTSPALTERLRHGETALLGRAASPGEIARCLCRLHDDSALRERLVMGAYAAASASSATSKAVLLSLIKDRQSCP